MLVRLSRRDRLVALEPFAEVPLDDEPALHQQVERPIHRRRAHGLPSAGHPARHVLGRQMIPGEAHGLRHREPLLGRREIVVAQVAAERPQQRGAVNLHTTPTARALPAAPHRPCARRRPASPAPAPRPASAPPPPPPPSPALAPSPAPPACTSPYKLAGERPARGASPPPSPTPAPPA